MCVACIIFNPVALSDLESMEDSNPHGAGVAWEQDGLIQFVKGLTAKEIHKMQEDKVMTYPYLMHYRWATHGDKIAELTHPFPIGVRALMGEIRGAASAVLIHNGTWNSYEQKAADYINQGNYEFPIAVLDSVSDTAVAAWLAKDNPDILDGVMWATAVAEMKTGADGILKMEITTRGEWSEKDGNWYSNLNWVNNYTYSYGYPGSYDGGDWEAWDRYYKTYKSPAAKNHEHLEANPSQDHRSVVERYLDRIAYDSDAKPYTLRLAEDEKLTYEQYTQKYGQKRNVAKKANENRAEDTDSYGTSWTDYLKAKYGSEAEDESTEETFSDSLSGGRSKKDICGQFCSAGAEVFDPSGPSESHEDQETEDYNSEAGRLDIDPDIISEDFETVNEVLRRAAGK